MDKPPVAEAQPTAIGRHVRGRVCVLTNPTARPASDVALIFDLPRALSALAGRSTRQPGRTTCWRWTPGGPAGPAYRVRLYAHGGALGTLLGTVFPSAGRMAREFQTALMAVARGVPTAVPVALRVERVLGPLVRAHLVTEEIADARNLLELCEAGEVAALPAASRRALAHAVGRCIAAMHGAGIVHADLNLKNILLCGAGTDRPQAFVLDFDKARVRQIISVPERRRNLARLDRSVLKWPASRQAIGLTDRLRVVRAYWAAAGLAVPRVRRRRWRR